MKTNHLFQSIVAIPIFCAAFVQPLAHACTRAVYLGPEGTNITVRSMDWFSDLGTNLWLFPRGMKRDGACGPKSPQWTSKYQVMTNSPTFDQQLALNAYWAQIGGTAMLPGTNRAADRFVRASFYVKAVPQTAKIEEAVASAFGIIRNASVPLGITTPGQPNISSTIWRTVADHKNLRYYYESTRSPNVFWVNVGDADFSEGKPTRTLKVSDGTVFAGNALDKFTEAQPFKFLPAEVK